MDLATWLRTVAARLELDQPLAAPLTTFRAGVAVGRGADLAATATAITDLLALPDPGTEPEAGPSTTPS
jgi:hypothetical protein